MSVSFSSSNNSPATPEVNKSAEERVIEYFQGRDLGCVAYCIHSVHYSCGVFGTQALLRNSRPFAVRDVVSSIFTGLKEAAQRGETSLDIKVSVGNVEEFMKSQKALYKLIFQKIAEEAKVNFDTESSEYSHSPLCELTESNSVTIKATWNPDNEVLTPKPPLRLETSATWGISKLNEKRKKGEGTDCEIVIGENKFPAHFLIVSAFSEYFNRLETFVEGTSKKFIIGIAEELSDEAQEALISYMYTQQLDLSKFDEKTVLKFLEIGKYLESEALQTLVISHFHSNSNLISDQVVLEMCLLDRSKLSCDINNYIGWLVKTHSDFYKGLVGDGSNPLDMVDYLNLLQVATEFDLKPLKEMMKVHWSAKEPEDKIEVMEQALSSTPEVIKFVKKCSKEFMNEIEEDRKRGAVVTSEPQEGESPTTESLSESVDRARVRQAYKNLCKERTRMNLLALENA